MRAARRSWRVTDCTTVLVVLGGSLAAPGGVIQVTAGNVLHFGQLTAESIEIDFSGNYTATMAALAEAPAITVTGGKRLFSSGTYQSPGGTIDLLAGDVAVVGATVDASGATGGGRVRVGGDYQGSNPDVPNAQTVYVSAGSTLRADAASGGAGGRVIVWADVQTEFYGSVSARGVSGDHVPDLIVGSGKNLLGGAVVKVYDGAALFNLDTAVPLASFQPYGAGYLGEVSVAAADFNGDGQADIVTGNAPATGPTVSVFNADDVLGGPNPPAQNSFQPFGPTLKGGVRVATGLVNFNSVPDIIVGQALNGSQVAVFSGTTGFGFTQISKFKAASVGPSGGVFVAAADLNKDGRAEIVVGLGKGARPEIHIFDGASLTPTTATRLHKGLAFPAGVTAGVRLALLDLDGDGKLDIVATAGPGTERRAMILGGGVAGRAGRLLRAEHAL